MVDHVPSQRNSPCDSLSPLDDTAKGKMKPDQDMFGDVIGFIYREKLLDGTSQLPLAALRACFAASSS